MCWWWRCQNTTVYKGINTKNCLPGDKQSADGEHSVLTMLSKITQFDHKAFPQTGTYGKTLYRIDESMWHNYAPTHPHTKTSLHSVRAGKYFAIRFPICQCKRTSSLLARGPPDVGSRCPVSLIWLSTNNNIQQTLQNNSYWRLWPVHWFSRHYGRSIKNVNLYHVYQTVFSDITLPYM